MITVKEISLYDYLKNFGSAGDALLDYSVKFSISSNNRNGLILGLYFDSKPVGLIVSVIEHSHIMSFLYVYIKEEMRGRGYSKALLNGAIEKARKRDVSIIKARVLPLNRYSSLIANMLLQKGFSCVDTATVLRCPFDEEKKKIWGDFIRVKGEKIVKYFERRGAKTLTYAEAPEMLEYIINNKREFPGYLTPMNYKNNFADKLIYDYSFVAVKNGKPVAYSTVTSTDGHKMVFQQLAASKSALGTGVALLPVIASVNKGFAEGKYEKISYTVYDSNSEMLSLAKGFLFPLAESVKTQNFYQLNIAR